ncbi:uncharacterized protein BCR38DRAFT_411274 [Pseudomassariella vexata]|uniref:Telomeric repeat-binding factor 2-interacting protein 1 n=1 Tax=Pseudomassariella vexata TaxID=1141098 RepID=A0A1Y2DQA8_9PEZI|nr:uncharacterized protein BCR38DRAFT_411274 [Pseudomassariella vexata]ORY61397.1 hypothetical protein BCR38DRAFT_411274 [Pseudomassariella vexata]
MSAGIVYQGIPGGSGGTLFKGKRFWVAHRVPNRATVIQNIENNGGEVVKLEKNADHLIADHARTDVPPGSYSWQFIQESVENGRLQNIEDYQNVRPTAEPRPVGSSQIPQKGTRTPFTPEDDRILMEWATRHEKGGNALSGHVIYKKLAEKYPHHTYQSWRDRWVKKLSHVPRSSVPDDEGSPSGGAPAATPVAALGSAPSPSAGRATPTSSQPGTQNSRPSGGPSPGSARATRAKFSEEEDQLLIDYIRECKENGKRLSGNTIYQELAEDFPQHTAHSWRDRYLRHLKPRVEHDEEPRLELSRAEQRAEQSRKAAKTRVSALPAIQEAFQRAPAGSSRINTVGHVQPAPKLQVVNVAKGSFHVKQATSVETSSKGAHFTNSAQKAIEDNELDTDGEEDPDELDSEGGKGTLDGLDEKGHNVALDESDPEVEEGAPDGPDAEGDNAALYEPNAEGDNMALDDSDAEAEEDPSIGTYRAKQQQQQSNATPRSRPSQQITHPAASSTFHTGYNPNKEQFYKDLQVYLANDTQARLQSIWPTVRGRTFELWDLWQAVMSQKVDPAERDWQQISELLYYNWVQYPTVPDEIRNCYDVHLSGFEEALIAFDENSDEEEDEDEDEDTVVQEPAAINEHEEETANMALAFTSSPPKQASLKRSFNAVGSSDHIHAETPRKHFKFTRSSVIPSTPDAVNGTARLRPSLSAAVSPADSRHTSLPRSSRSTKSNRKGKQVATETDRAEDSRVLQLPNNVHTRKPALEPETQDFRFEETQNVEFNTPVEEQSQTGITPSQQLRLESDAQPSEYQPSPHVTRTQLSPGQTTPTPKRKAQPPFLLDENDEENAVTPKPRFGKGPNPALSVTQSTKPKRRTLPASFSPRYQTKLAPLTAQTQLEHSFPPNSTAESSRAEQSDSKPCPTQTPKQTSVRPHENITPAPSSSVPSKGAKFIDIVEYYMSLGYPQHIARRSLDATSWNRGLAGEVMENLKKGNGLPTNWEGVWTERDDESLRLIDSVEPAKDQKEAKKRQKETKRLLTKHGEAHIALRRKWLNTVIDEP